MKRRRRLRSVHKGRIRRQHDLLSVSYVIFACNCLLSFSVPSDIKCMERPDKHEIDEGREYKIYLSAKALTNKTVLLKTIALAIPVNC